MNILNKIVHEIEHEIVHEIVHEIRRVYTASHSLHCSTQLARVHLLRFAIVSRALLLMYQSQNVNRLLTQGFKRFYEKLNVSD
jgi:hypothetical protein